MSRPTPEREAEIREVLATGRLKDAGIDYTSSGDAVDARDSLLGMLHDTVAELDAVRAEADRLVDLACTPEGAVDMRVHLMLAAEVGRIESRVAALEARAEPPTVETPLGHPEMTTAGPWSGSPADGWRRERIRADGPPVTVAWVRKAPDGWSWLWGTWAGGVDATPASTAEEALFAADAWLRDRGWTLEGEP